MTNGHEIHKADPALRRRLLFVVVAIFATGLAVNYYLQHYLDAATISPQLLIARLRMTVYIFALSLLPAIYFAYHLFLSGRRVVRENRFPPSGASVIKDTTVLRGQTARFRGYAMQVFSVLLIASLVSMPPILLYILALFAPDL